MTPQEVTIGDGLVLKSVSLEYLPDIFSQFTEKVIRYLTVEEVPKSPDDTRQFIEASQIGMKEGRELVWVILHQGRFTGCCGVHSIKTREPHFGLWIREDSQGKGYGKRIVRFMLPWVLANLEVDHVKYPVDAQNRNSLSLIEGMGLQFDHAYELGVGKKLNVHEYRLYA